MEPLQRLTRRQLETLLKVESFQTPDRSVPLTRLAKALHVAPPTALAHLAVLEELGLVERSRGKTRLSRRGSTCVREYTRHHRVAESLFARAGLGPREACAAAREVDLALSHRVVDQVCESERHPARCPHGQPIDPCDTPHRRGSVA